MTLLRKILVAFTLLLLVLFVTACEQNKTDKFQVVASTTMLGDAVSQIGKDKVDITLLFGPGVDPHLVQPIGFHTKAIQKADLVIFSGFQLESQFSQVLNAYRKKTLIVGDKLDPSQLLLADEEIDPHFWFSVPLWKDVVRAIGNELKVKDSQNADFYETNTIAYLNELEALHQWIIAETLKLTKAQRVLVTAHDAFKYFAHTYDFEVASVDGISTEGETRTEDIEAVVNIIVEKNVKAIFIESTISPTTINAVIQGAKDKGVNVIVGGELYSDSLGTGEDAMYINAIRKNVNYIVNGLK